MQDTADRENMFDVLRQSLPSLSPKMKIIATFALDHPQEFIRQTSKDLCATLNTSEPTMIRFCKRYGRSGLSEFRIDLALSLVTERLGEATGERSVVEPRASDRRKLNSDRKSAIARAAIELVRDDNAILLDNGSTAESFASEMGALPPMTVMTSGLTVALAALAHEKHNVIVTGGTVRAASMCMTGWMVREATRNMQFDTFVMGADSISLEHGITTFLEDEAENMRVMMKAARRIIVLADGSKFTKPSLHRICDIASVEQIVTDLPADDPTTRALIAAGARLHLI
ncbi:transcriptional regulator [Pseudooceanicola sp. CBS1P-1]|uniref:Transcriptional regulator n=1 Tax=Pseudooceanicola albus TaxID=2692189 RepID=A0A6L7G3C7_9RHOB|nr:MULTISPECIES: DeoR/GlpR transcriptional regulator [Pseudooceanicola]MBT9385197.1 transcriptional regulator [Pseudooceanicola endophyticus]MXN18511.1 transcriptional regulator [Pseudooceanicola albus]